MSANDKVAATFHPAPAPEPRNRSKQRIEGMHRRINEWEAQGHRTVTIAWLRRHFAGFEPGKDTK